MDKGQKSQTQGKQTSCEQANATAFCQESSMCSHSAAGEESKEKQERQVKCKLQKRRRKYQPAFITRNEDSFDKRENVCYKSSSILEMEKKTRYAARPQIGFKSLGRNQGRLLQMKLGSQKELFLAGHMRRRRRQQQALGLMVWHCKTMRSSRSGSSNGYH